MPSDFKPMLNVGPGPYEIRLHVQGEWQGDLCRQVRGWHLRFACLPEKTQKTRVEDIELAARRYRQIGAMERSPNRLATCLPTGFSAEESALLAMRAELMARLRTIAERGWTQTEAASHLGIGNPAFPTWCAASGEIQPRHAGHPGHPRRSQGGGGDRLIRHRDSANRSQTRVLPAPFCWARAFCFAGTAFRPWFPLRQQKSRLNSAGIFVRYSND